MFITLISISKALKNLGMRIETRMMNISIMVCKNVAA
jgi:hypothetical protein